MGRGEVLLPRFCSRIAAPAEAGCGAPRCPISYVFVASFLRRETLAEEAGSDGGDVMSEDALDFPAVRRRLEALLAECRAASTATADDRKPVELDQTTVGRLSRVDAMQRQAMAQAADRQRQVQIQRLRAALERLDEGEYGTCVRCGDTIAPRRLEADPAVPTCIACARG